jgi:hypothetical protein
MQNDSEYGNPKFVEDWNKNDLIIANAKKKELEEAISKYMVKHNLIKYVRYF